MWSTKRILGGMLFGMTMFPGGAFAAQFQFIPTQLKCPSENNQVLELTSINEVKDTQRFRAYYDQKLVSAISIEAAASGEPFEMEIYVEMASIDKSYGRLIAKIHDKKSYGAAWVKIGDSLIQYVCLGSLGNRKQLLNAWWARVVINPCGTKNSIC